LHSLEIADFNNDTIPDYAVSANDGTVYFVNGLNNDILYSHTVDPLFVSDMKTSDFNGDGITDVVIFSNFTVSFINGANGLLLYSNNDAPDWIQDITLANITGDEIIDVVVSTWDWVNGRVIFIDGATGLTLYNTVLDNWGQTIAAADISGDGITDVVVGDYEGRVYLLDGSTGDIVYTKQISENISESIFVGHNEINNTFTIVLGTLESNVYFLNATTGDLLFSNSDPLESVDNIISDDFNGDDIPDFAVGAENVYFMDGSNGQTMFRGDISPLMITAMTAADVTSDGVLDILVGSRDSNMYLLNGADGALIYDNISPRSWLLDLDFADINQDGHLDFIVTSGSELYIIERDTYDPIVTSLLLPQVRTSDSTMKFTLNYDEPNLDHLEILYYYKEEIQKADLIQEEEGNYSVFSISSFKESNLKLWININDTWGSSNQYFNSTQPYELAIFTNQVQDLNISESGVRIVYEANLTLDAYVDFIILLDDDSIKFVDGETNQFLPQNLDFKDGIGGSAVADFNLDGITDLVISETSIDRSIHFIDGSIGEVMYSNVDGFWGYDQLKVVDFNLDSVPDLIGIENGDVHFIDGTNGISIFEYNVETIWDVYIGHLNDDSYPDVIAVTADKDLIYLDGQTGEPFLTISNCDMVTDIYLYDVNNDQITDFVCPNSNGSILVMDGNDGEILLNISDHDSSVYEIIFHDFTGDGRIDILSTAADNLLRIHDSLTGEEFFRLEIDEVSSPLSSHRITVQDYDFDGFDDIILSKFDWTGIYLIDGHTLKVQDIIKLPENQIATEISVSDGNKDGIATFTFGTTQGNLISVQSLHPFLSIGFNLTYPTQFNQGDRVELSILPHDRFNNSITFDDFSLVVKKADDDTFISLRGNQINEIEIFFNFTTENWLIGEWSIYPLITSKDYHDLTLTDYQDWSGRFLPMNKISVLGMSSSEIRLSSSNAVFNPEASVLNNVKEGNNISVDVLLKDSFSHFLDGSEINLTVSFNGLNYSGIISEPSNYLVTIPTNRLDHGIYDLQVYFSGTHLIASSSVLQVEIVPNFLDITITEDLLTLIFIYSFFYFMPITLFSKLIYSKMKGMKTGVSKVLLSVMFLDIAYLTATLYFSWLFYSTDILVSFFLITIAFGELIVLYFFLFFRILYNRVMNEVSGLRSWLSVSFLLLPVAGLLFTLLSLSGEIQWFSYYLAQEHITFFTVEIPKIYWDIGVIGFSTGFLTLIINEIYENHQDVKHLRVLNEEISKGYYPKQPDKLLEAKTEISLGDFKSLLKTFLIWYALILYTLFNTFQAFSLLPLLAALLIPALLSIVLVFRPPFLKMIGALF
ncbi:MAG: PQQ-binding-like beta-propeller repeat protein, partial [Candidatus Heimdallarchaeota archaeon]|nr:PQQ-binding-like beta-propeller repeat protein [Candidatus Heimdallarchaeota archaeon]